MAVRSPVDRVVRFDFTCEMITVPLLLPPTSLVYTFLDAPAVLALLPRLIDNLLSRSFGPGLLPARFPIAALLKSMLCRRRDDIGLIDPLTPLMNSSLRPASRRKRPQITLALEFLTGVPLCALPHSIGRPVIPLVQLSLG
jgi:hypothetical protein